MSRAWGRQDEPFRPRATQRAMAYTVSEVRLSIEVGCKTKTKTTINTCTHVRQPPKALSTKTDTIISPATNEVHDVPAPLPHQRAEYSVPLVGLLCAALHHLHVRHQRPHERRDLSERGHRFAKCVVSFLLPKQKITKNNKK